jgi:murein DD-endopeptidase MepM/ murein hydrolase activator NlpD
METDTKKITWPYFLLFLVPALILLILVQEKTLNRRKSPDRGATVEPSLTGVGGYEIDLEEVNEPVTSRLLVRNGDTLLDLFSRHGISIEDTQESIEAFSELFDPRRIKPGQEVILYYTDKESLEFTGFGLQLDPKREIVVQRTSYGSFEAERLLHDFDKELIWGAGTIRSTLYESVLSIGLPINVLLQMVQLYSFDVDFQREIRLGDFYEVFYEREIGPAGAIAGEEYIVYARMVLSGREIEIFRYTDFEGQTDYFGPMGKSVRKTLLKTPLPGSRITSGYGMRKSPILGYTRFHPALDFAAPSGTPVLASGDGTVVFARYNDVYGHHIKLSHANGYSTLYAHLSAYAGNIRKGRLVTQGDTIGFVGNTGMSTGSHLHYEVLYQGDNINPAVVDVPPGKILQGEELEEFLVIRDEIISNFTERNSLKRAWELSI